ncbi:MAG: DUF3570 domain-containing protein [Pseudomonadota bacterium]|nr:DUF3570 domain-containing protein [Pseudomonadota bacterium]
MQLKPAVAIGAPNLRRALKLAAAGLLASGTGRAQEAPPEAPNTNVDSGVLYYQELGRVQAIEPELNVSYKINEDSTISIGAVADALTGPTPLGAVPSTLPQTYIRPYEVIPLGTPVTATTASGGSTIVLIPPRTGAKTQTLAASTVVPPNTYPLDQAFQDNRFAGHVGWEQALSSTFKLIGGLAYSKEHDYRSESANLGISKDFNAHNTTFNAAVNYESDLSFPIGGTPTPLTVMSGDWKGPDATRHEVDAVVGVTQVMTRRWLTTLSYSYADSKGYQNDPYKIISVVDSVSGQPTSQLYESRPETRRKQSVFLDNKIHLSSDVIALSLRGYKDDWGIKSVTADLRYRYQLTQDYYLEPHFRYYEQGAADFFRYYLVAGEALPQHASADTRLAKFNAQTYGLKFGMPINRGSEFNIRVEYYDQHGNGAPAFAIGQLRQQNLFPNLQAVMVLLGYTYAF